MSTEARRSPRHRLEIVVPVVNAMTNRAMGFTRDISAGGMQLASAEPLVDDALYQVLMELDGAGRPPVEAGVQVITQRRDGDQVLVGMRFIHLAPAHAGRLSTWLAARAPVTDAGG